MAKLTLVVIGATAGLAALGMGLVPAWTIVPFAASGLLIWGLIEYWHDRPMSGQG